VRLSAYIGKETQARGGILLQTKAFYPPATFRLPTARQESMQSHAANGCTSDGLIRTAFPKPTNRPADAATGNGADQISLPVFASTAWKFALPSA
jgi:hypothetical protein